MFRMYDANDPVDTIATSHAWQVDAQGRDVELSLRFVLNQLRSTDGKGSVMGALAQLAHLLRHLQVSEGRVVVGGDGGGDGGVGVGVGVGFGVFVVVVVVVVAVVVVDLEVSFVVVVVVVAVVVVDLEVSEGRVVVFVVAVVSVAVAVAYVFYVLCC